MVKCVLTADSVPLDAPTLHLGAILLTSVHLQDVGLVGVEDVSKDLTYLQNDQADEMQALGLPSSFTATRISSQPGGKRQRRKKGSPTSAAGKDTAQLQQGFPGTPPLPGSPAPVPDRPCAGSSDGARPAAPCAGSEPGAGGSVGTNAGSGNGGSNSSCWKKSKGAGGAWQSAARHSGATDTTTIQVLAGPSPAGVLPSGRWGTGQDGWVKVLDPETRRHYYFNTSSQVSQWDLPDTSTAPAAAPAATQPPSTTTRASTPTPPPPSTPPTAPSPPPSPHASSQPTPPPAPSPQPAAPNPSRSYLSIASATVPPTAKQDHPPPPPASDPITSFSTACASAVLPPPANPPTQPTLASNSYAAVVTAAKKLSRSQPVGPTAPPHPAPAAPRSWPPTNPPTHSLPAPRHSLDLPTPTPAPATAPPAFAATAAALVAGTGGGQRVPPPAGKWVATRLPAASDPAAGGAAAAGGTAAALRLKLPRKVQRYYLQRYSLFSLFDRGVEMDDEGWFSVTPEVLAAHQARRCAQGLAGAAQGQGKGAAGGQGRGWVAVDAFAGCGGNVIQLAKIFQHVIGIEISADRAGMVGRNAAVYGVEEQVEVVVGDFFEAAPSLAADVLFMSPPWGGPDYKYCGVFDPLENIPGLGCSVAGLVEVARGVVGRGGGAGGGVAVFLPRNVDLMALAEVVPEGEVWEVERAFLNGKLKGVTLYCGALAGAAGRGVVAAAAG